MPQYKFFIDCKVTIWERNTYHIVADSLEEATQKMKGEFETGTCDEQEVGFQECETLYDTQYPLTPGENGNNYTRELIYAGDSSKQTTICNNSPGDKAG